MKLKYFILFAVLFFACGIGASFFIWHNSPEVISKVTENSTNPDLTIQSTGTLTGQVKVTPPPKKTVKQAEKTKVKDETIPPETPAENEGILALVVGEEFTTEMTGEIKTKYINSEGQEVGEGIHPVAAILTAKVKPDGLDFQLDYKDSVPLEINYKPPETHHRIDLEWDGSIKLNYTYNNKTFYCKYSYDFEAKIGKPAIGLTYEF